MVKLDPRKNIFGPRVPLWEKGQQGGRTRPINAQILFDITCQVVDVFEKHKIKWCLSHGTVLGLYRDHDVIPWDDDVDIALTDMSQRMKVAVDCRKEFEKLGFFMPPIGDKTRPVNGFGPKPNMPYYDSVLIKNGEKVECWWFEKTGKYYIYDPTREGLAIPRKFMDTFEEIEWRGRKFKIPAHTTEYLDIMYGRNKWQTPDKNKKYNPLRAV